jgi:uncharacterized protein (TIGR02594 family)
MSLPSKYRWIESEPGPRMLKAMLALYGTLEKPGSGDNPLILAWARECGIPEYKHDSIPWCGLCCSIAALRADWPHKPNGNALWARNWANWEEKAPRAMLGDVLVFERAGGFGHVGLYVGEDDTCYHVLGGNQSDAVNIKRIEKNRLIAARHPKWRIAEPPNRRVVKMTADGPVSRNEA